MIQLKFCLFSNLLHLSTPLPSSERTSYMEAPYGKSARVADAARVVSVRSGIIA